MSVSHNITTGHRTRWSCLKPGVGPGIELLVPGGPSAGPCPVADGPCVGPTQSELSSYSYRIHSYDNSILNHIHYCNMLRTAHVIYAAVTRTKCVAAQSQTSHSIMISIIYYIAWCLRTTKPHQLRPLLVTVSQARTRTHASWSVLTEYE
jgi:hypothetical protein